MARLVATRRHSHVGGAVGGPRIEPGLTDNSTIGQCCGVLPGSQTAGSSIDEIEQCLLVIKQPGGGEGGANCRRDTKRFSLAQSRSGKPGQIGRVRTCDGSIGVARRQVNDGEGARTGCRSTLNGLVGREAVGKILGEQIKGEQVEVVNDQNSSPDRYSAIRTRKRTFISTETAAPTRRHRNRTPQSLKHGPLTDATARIPGNASPARLARPCSPAYRSRRRLMRD